MTDDRTDKPFRDAEAWLAAQGVPREPIRVEVPPAEEAHASAEAGRTASEVASASAEASVEAAEDEGPGDLSDEVSKALSYARRATANTPMSEGRLRRRLGERNVPDAVVVLAMERARTEGIVDDGAFAAALVEEARRKGHAPLRIRTDLERRELPNAVIESALATIGDRDEEAAAFDVAQRKAASYRGVDAETAFRRLVGFLSRRGYTDGLSRKVARQVVFHDREPERTAGR